MSIWSKGALSNEISIDKLNSMSKGTIHEALNIHFSAVGDDFLEASMPVNEKTRQPFGILHGGASVVLAESLGSVASRLVAGHQTKAMGIEVNASHLRAASGGCVYGRAIPIRLGKLLHVWEIKIRSEASLDSPLICICRLTVVLK